MFAVYVLALLLTLLVFGSLSDYLGRRRVIAVALAAGAGACGLFLAAHGAGLLFAARALQGAAVGAATSAAGAALIDLQPGRSGRGPVVTSAAVLLGLGAGGLGTSALAQYAPAPTHLIWWLLLGACAAAAIAVLAIPETRPGRAGVLAALRPRVAVPRQARGTLAVALPVMIAAPALNGFYLSLGPSLAAQVLGSPDLLWGGLVIFLVAGTGAAATVAFRAVSPPAAMLAGCLALLAGAVMTLAAIETASAAAFLAGTAVAGAGVGTGFFAGAYRVLTALASPGQRAGTGRRHLDRLLPGVQRPRRGRRGGHHALRPAPDRRGLLRRARRPRRGGRGQLPVPQALAALRDRPGGGTAAALTLGIYGKPSARSERRKASSPLTRGGQASSAKEKRDGGIRTPGR